MSPARRGFAPTLLLSLSVAMTVACSGSDASVGPADPAPGGSASGNGNGATSPTSGGGTGTPGNPPTSDDAGTGTPAPDAGGGTTPDAGGDPTGGDADAPGGNGGLDPSVAPGGNFDLSVWELQEPFGSPGAPNTISSAQLQGAKGFHDKYFFSDPTDGSMTFFDPENGVTTPNSHYPRCELREMNKSGSAANWLAPGTHTLTATVKATAIPDHVAVGQIHLGTGTPASTKPLLELFYYATGKIEMAIEQSPAGGNEVPHPVGSVPLGTKWSYVIGLSGNTISFTLNGGAPQTFAMDPSFDQEGMYFKAGNYDQSVGTDANVAANVQFYALTIAHSK